MSALEGLEKPLEKINKDLPALPTGGKQFLVKAWPWLALIFGVLQLLAAYSLWHLGHRANDIINTYNSIAKAYGVDTGVVSLNVFYWIALVVLIVDAAILLLAYPKLVKHQKSGWDLLFLGALINLVYGVVAAFASYGSFGNLIGALIGSAIGLYLLFQIRDYYTGKASLAHDQTPNAPKAE